MISSHLIRWSIKFKTLEIKFIMCIFLIENLIHGLKKDLKLRQNKEGYYGEVYHPIIYLINTMYYVYFDWLREGFSIRVHSYFDVIGKHYIGQATLNQVYNACLNNSTSYYY